MKKAFFGFYIYKIWQRRTELFPCEHIAMSNFYSIIRDMVKTLEYDVFTIIISIFDYKVFVFNSKT